MAGVQCFTQCKESLSVIPVSQRNAVRQLHNQNPVFEIDFKKKGEISNLHTSLVCILLIPNVLAGIQGHGNLTFCNIKNMKK